MQHILDTYYSYLIHVDFNKSTWLVCSELRRSNSLDIASFGLFEVDDIPDSGKVLRQGIRTLQDEKRLHLRRP